MTTITHSPPSTQFPHQARGDAPNSTKAKLRRALRDLQTSDRARDEMKENNKVLRAELRAKDKQLEKLTRPGSANLPALVRAHRAAVEDGVGNWGKTEAALFEAVR